ncbi:hypothetical protein [Bradyrhizobium sp. i1.15.2]|uniref:hypothetical protein n=1 Tax=Bradyrhizobium sp. i1.15.2 TaxID=3156362 RepID=UPI003393E394
MRHAIGIDEKLEFDLTGTMRGSARPEWFRCRFRVLRWRLIDHSALDDHRFRGGFALPEEAGDGLRSLVVLRNRTPIPRARMLADRRCV